jgi:hypothetical protein
MGQAYDRIGIADTGSGMADSEKQDTGKQGCPCQVVSL